MSTSKSAAKKNTARLNRNTAKAKSKLSKQFKPKRGRNVPPKKGY